VEEPLRKQAWDYFQLHAAQRLTTFNFYLVACSAIAAGEVASFHKDFNFPALRIVLGCLLIVLSFVFWRLDERNRLLIKNAEAALKFFEEQDAKDPAVTHLFRMEERVTDSKGLFHLSYAMCFRIVFVVFGLLGAASIPLSALKHSVN